MRPIDDFILTPDERRSEVAGILAAGVLRLSAMALLATDATNHLASANSQESAPSCLEVPAETVLSVHNG